MKSNNKALAKPLDRFGLTPIKHPLDKLLRKQKFVSMHQGTAINVLAGIGQVAVKNCLDCGSLGFLRNDVEIVFDNRNIYLDGRTQQVLYYIIQLYISKVGKKPSDQTIIENLDLVIKVSDVARLFGMTLLGAKKMLKRAILTLYYLSVAWKEKKDVYEGKKKITIKDKVRIRFLSRIDEREVTIENIDDPPEETREELDPGCLDDSLYKISRGYYIVRLERSFAKYLPWAPTLWYPLALYRIVPVRQSNAFAFGLQLVLHFRMNKEKFVEVKVLLNCTTDIPFHDSIKEKGEMSRKIIIPFIKGMDALVTVGVLKYWYFLDPVTLKKVPEDVMRRIRYDDFEKLYVYYVLLDYPGLADDDETNTHITENSEICDLVIEASGKDKLVSYGYTQPTLFSD